MIIIKTPDPNSFGVIYQVLEKEDGPVLFRAKGETLEDLRILMCRGLLTEEGIQEMPEESQQEAFLALWEYYKLERSLVSETV